MLYTICEPNEYLSPCYVTFYLTVRVSVLGSGSSGNCTYISTKKTRVLVDLGFGFRSLSRRLRDAGLEEGNFDGILLTHGHRDHVSGTPPFLSKHSVPVFMNGGTREEISAFCTIDQWEPFDSNSTFRIGDLQIKAFSVSHDAAEPVGFRFTAEGVSGALVTDLGELDDPVIRHLEGCDWLVLESNHDEEMLKLGPYPWHVKQRVLSNVGHLSNQELADFFRHHFDRGARHIFLAHLSRQNNDPAIALSQASSALFEQHPRLNQPIDLHLTFQDRPSVLLNL